MASRRCPSPTRPSSENQSSPASGPRLSMHSRVAITSSRSTAGAAPPYAKIALMPHMARECIRQRVPLIAIGAAASTRIETSLAAIASPVLPCGRTQTTTV